MEELDFSETSVHMKYIRCHIRLPPPPKNKVTKIFETLFQIWVFILTLLKLFTCKVPTHSFIERVTK